MKEEYIIQFLNSILKKYIGGESKSFFSVLIDLMETI